MTVKSQILAKIKINFIKIKIFKMEIILNNKKY